MSGLATIKKPANADVIQSYSQQEQSLIRTTVGQDLSTEEFKLFLYLASMKKLNPLANELWPVKYGGKNARMVLQTSIEGYMKIAHQTGKFAGFGPATCVIRNKEGALEEIPLVMFDPDNHTLIRAVARVLHKDYAEPQVYHADYSFYCKNYDGRPNNFWKDGPLHMLYKCAQAVALRRTFPSELGGIYTGEEMAQAGPEPINVIYQEVPVTPASKEDIDAKWSQIIKYLEKTGCDESGIAFAELSAKKTFNVESISDITNAEALAKWARKDLLVELQQENFLPMPRNK